MLGLDSAKDWSTKISGWLVWNQGGAQWFPVTLLNMEATKSSPSKQPQPVLKLPAILPTCLCSTNIKLHQEYNRRKSFFSLQTTFHEEFEPLIISDNSILLSSERHPFSERWSAASYSTLWPRYIQLRNGLADKHHANFDFSLVFHGIMSIEFNSNSEWIVLEIVIYVYTWCMIFQINFEADVFYLVCQGGL